MAASFCATLTGRRAPGSRRPQFGDACAGVALEGGELPCCTCVSVCAWCTLGRATNAVAWMFFVVWRGRSAHDRASAALLRPREDENRKHGVVHRRRGQHSAASGRVQGEERGACVGAAAARVRRALSRPLSQFFKQDIILQQFNGGVITPGAYSLPFQYQLPAQLPGVFYDQRKEMDGDKVKGAIMYKVKVCLDIKGSGEQLPARLFLPTLQCC